MPVALDIIWPLGLLSSLLITAHPLDDTRDLSTVVYGRDVSGAYTVPPQIKVAATNFVGNISSLSTTLARDLGWHGQVGGTSFNAYGDTLWCTSPDQNECAIFATNTLSISTNDPLKVQDFNTSGPQNLPTQFCPLNAAWGETPVTDWAIGITNIVQTVDDHTGVIFFTRNYRPATPGQAVTSAQNHMQGAGVATVHTDYLYPGCDRFEKQWWSAATEPLWGDHGVVDGNDGFIYAFGEFGGLIQQIMLCRAPKDSVTELDKFEYWDGNCFTPNRLQNPGPTQVVLPDTNQGSIFRSDYQKAWISLTRSVAKPHTLTVRTAANLQGPWSNETEVYTGDEGLFLYAPCYHPEFDTDGGKTWHVSITVFPNIQQMITIEFE